jgi:hypothetical protein
LPPIGVVITGTTSKGVSITLRVVITLICLLVVLNPT